MTKPKQKIIAKLNLENQNCMPLLPMLKRVRKKTEPLFPSYLFINFDPDYKWLKIRNTRGVKNT